jgi:hyaluronate lyase
MIDQLSAKNHSNWKGSIPLFAIESTVALMSDSTVTYEPYLATKVMRNMDRVVHHGTKYGVALAMSSTRMYKYEAINANGELGWYLGDGALYLYTDGYDYGFHHFDYSNPYLVAGTTVNLAQRNEVCITPSFNNANPFAGGTSQGLYGAAGFILSNPENAPTFADSNAKKITAKKSYFFFDNEIVCLGSDINDVSGKRVITTVDNRLWSLRWTKDGYLFDMGELVIDGQKVESATVIRKEEHNTAIPTLNTMTKLNSRAMWFKNMGGYVFLDNSDVYYQVAANPINKIITAGTGTRDYLEIVIDHGVGDGSLENNAYAYLYLPELSAAETESYAQSPDVAIVRRNNKTHAVIEKTLGIFSCIVFDADSFNVNNDATNIKSVDAQTPLALMVSKDESGQTLISVSDPTQTYRQIIIDLEIDGISQVVSADENVEASISGGILSITVKNAKETPGASFNLTVK